MTWAIRPTVFGLFAFAISATTLYFTLPFVLTPISDNWLGWFPILVLGGASIIAGYVTGRLSGRPFLGFWVGFLGVAVILTMATAYGTVSGVLPIGVLGVVAVMGGVLGVSGSFLAAKMKRRGDDL